MNLLRLQPFQQFNENIKPPVYIHNIEKGYIEHRDRTPVQLLFGK